MKKICCMLLVCMRIITGISIPTFAVGDLDAKIVELTEEQVTKLENCVNDTFKDLVNEKDFLDCNGELFDAVCCGDLLSKYYLSVNRIKDMQECLAKVYTLKAEMVWSSLGGHPYTFESIRIERYLLKKASAYAKESLNGELYSYLETKLNDMDEKVLKLAAGERLFIYDGFLSRIYAGTPESEQEYTELLSYIKYAFNNIDNCKNCLNESDLFFRNDGIECALKINCEKTYDVEDVFKSILLGHFNFGNRPCHIAFGIFMDN